MVNQHFSLNGVATFSEGIEFDMNLSTQALVRYVRQGLLRKDEESDAR